MLGEASSRSGRFLERDSGIVTESSRHRSKNVGCRTPSHTRVGVCAFYVAILVEFNSAALLNNGFDLLSDNGLDLLSG